MSERTPKQPLNDPEYTVPEYSVLLPSDEAENSTVESSAAEDNALGASTPEQATTGYPGGDRRLHRACRLRAGNSEAPAGYAQRHVVRCRHYRAGTPE